MSVPSGNFHVGLKSPFDEPQTKMSPVMVMSNFEIAMAFFFMATPGSTKTESSQLNTLCATCSYL